MRIGIDAHAIGSRAGGNETYMRELLFALREIESDLAVIALAHRTVPDSALAHWPRRDLPALPSPIRVPVVLPWAALKERLDLLHVQYIAPPVCPCPYIVSVHDVGWLKHPEWWPALMRRRMQALLPRTLRRAARVFALTGAMADEIAQAYGVDRSRIGVVPPGVDPRWFQKPTDAKRNTILQKYSLPANYVLYAGSIQPRKNLVRLARAFARLKHWGLPHVLVLVGEAGWLSEECLREIESTRLEQRIIRLHYVPADDLTTLYHGAAAVAYPSLYEGFGLPVLEAMACGTPVLASDIPAIREVARDGALLVDPLDEDAVADGLRRVVEDVELRARLRSVGLARATQFTRMNMAERALAGYQTALG